MTQLVKNPPAMQETLVPSLGGKDRLEKEMATCCSILAWEIPWTEEPGGLQSMKSQKGQPKQSRVQEFLETCPLFFFICWFVFSRTFEN